MHLLVFVYMTLVGGIVAENSYSIYPYHNQDFSTSLIQKTSGSDIVLKCATNCTKSNQFFRWEFKPCGREFNKTHCNVILENITKTYYPERDPSWTQKHNKKCIMYLHNVTQNNSGLYRCLEDDTISTIFNVEIINDPSTIYKSKPKLLEIMPLNTTTNSGTQILIQCKVHSDFPPEIRWFKQVDVESKDTILYYNNLYVHINSSEQFIGSQGVDVYISKLKIFRAHEYDSGTYRCVAMTGSGTDHKDAYVYVIPSDVEEVTSFSLLFLIPFCLALVPITMWLCYNKRKTNRKIVNNPSGFNNTNARRYKYTNTVIHRNLIDRNPRIHIEFKV